MGLVFCGVSPHPPLLVPEIGQEKVDAVKASQQALETLSREVVERRPDCVVMISPHGPVRIDALSLLAAETIEASFSGFDRSYQIKGDPALAERIRAEGQRAGFPVFAYRSFDSSRYYFSRGLDHASMVPLYYLEKAGLGCPMVFLSIAAWSHRDHFEFGRALRRAFEEDGRSIVFIASGDLSHRLLPSAPYGFEPRGKAFDDRVVDDLARVDAQDILALDDALIESIGECGLRPISALLGALQGGAATGRVYSYEGPFGVGYCVAALEPGAPLAEPEGAPALQTIDPATVLAIVRDAVEQYVLSGQAPDVPTPLPAGLDARAGAFVCLKREGQLRGCIGTTVPTQGSLAEELVRNAVSAASRDPRFPPIQPDELAGLSYSVDVLEAPEAVASTEDLDAQEYGVIVRSGQRSGVLLPKLDGVDTVQMQVDIARRKAGILDGEPLELLRFRVRRYGED